MAGVGGLEGIATATVARVRAVVSLGVAGLDSIRADRMARAAGMDAQSLARATFGRPADVVRAGATYVPRFGSLGPDDVARGRSLVTEALDGLQPVLVANRRSDSARALLRERDGFLGTIHTAPYGKAGLYRQARAAWEKLRGIHGEGDLAGHTTFASVQFVPRPGTPLAGELGSTLERVALRRGAFGVRRFGEAALELRPGTTQRATFTARDSGFSLTPASPAPVERLDEVVLERLARSHGFQLDRGSAVNAYRTGVFGDASESARRAQFIGLLRDTPRDDAVDAVRRYLVSDTLADINHMVEAQVRGVRRADIVRVHAEQGFAGAVPLLAAG